MMTSLLQKVSWWLRRRRKEDDLREELQFHLEEEADERRARGLLDDQAVTAAYRDLGNPTLLREDTRTLWTWMWLEQLAQDVRYGVRMLRRNPAFTAVVALSLALGIGANTAIYSFMDAMLLRPLPVRDAASLVAVKWRSKPFAYGSRATNGSEFVLHAIDGDFFEDASGQTGAILPFAALERLAQVSAPVLDSIFGFFTAGKVNVVVKGAAELSTGEYVSGDFFRGLQVFPVAGRPILAGDDRAGAPLVAVVSMAYGERRFGGAANAVGRPILVNNVAFTVVGVAPPGFFGVDPGAAPDLYLPMHATLLLIDDGPRRFVDQNYYWLEIMGRLGPQVSMAQAQNVLAPPFAQWAATTATNDRERANLPALRLEPGAAGRDIVRRTYSKPLYLLLAMVGFILAIACANTANLLLARAAARRREIALRLSLGAGRLRVVRQLLVESVLLASLGGALGILVAVAGIRVLTLLLANGQERFTVQADLNWHVLAATLGLSLVCGVLFGLAPAIQATRPELLPTLKDPGGAGFGAGVRQAIPRLSLARTLVVAQIAISVLLLVAAGLFVQTLSNLHSIPLGFNREHLLLFEVNAPQGGQPASQVPAFYAALRQKLSEIPGVRDATLSHASLVKAGRAHPISVDGVASRGHRVLATGPRFFTTMQIAMLRGREIEERDRPGRAPVAVISHDFAIRHFGEEDPVGRHIRLGGAGTPNQVDLEIVGVAATVRYGGLKGQVPPVVYIPYAVAPQLEAMTYALRTDGDPLRYVAPIREIVRKADARVPVTEIRTQADDIDQTINQEIIFARLGSAFAVLALVIASVGLYGTMSYTVARRTTEIGIRMALGARRGLVVWLVLREVCVLAAAGLAISVPTAIASSRILQSFLFDLKSNDSRVLAFAVGTLLTAALLAAYAPARRASRVEPMIALRHE